MSDSSPLPSGARPVRDSVRDLVPPEVAAPSPPALGSSPSRRPGTAPAPGGAPSTRPGTVPGRPAGPVPARGRRLAWLDALRGIAALFVVLNHLDFLVLKQVRSAMAPAFDPGLYGVFVFFMAS